MTDAREWLEDIHSCSSGDTTDPGVALHLTAAALLAVLDLHREDYELGPIGTCRECYGEDWPCATVRAINEALGVTDE